MEGKKYSLKSPSHPPIYQINRYRYSPTRHRSSPTSSIPRYSPNSPSYSPTSLSYYSTSPTSHFSDGAGGCDQPGSQQQSLGGSGYQAETPGGDGVPSLGDFSCPPPGYDQYGGQSGGGGGYSNYGNISGNGLGAVVEKVQSDNQIFVQGLPTDATTEDIAQFFGSIGHIKSDMKTGHQRIFLKYNSAGLPKGEATVTYIDPNDAQSAIQWFNGKDFNGKKITVSMAVIKVRIYNQLKSNCSFNSQLRLTLLQGSSWWWSRTRRYT